METDYNLYLNENINNILSSYISAKQSLVETVRQEQDKCLHELVAVLDISSSKVRKICIHCRLEELSPSIFLNIDSVWPDSKMNPIAKRIFIRLCGSEFYKLRIPFIEVPR